MENKKIKGKDIFFEILRKNGINKIFGNPGTTEMPMINALNENPDFEYILNLHESVAVGVAAGYSMALNKPALVNVHTYSGLSNAMCNIYNAFLAEVPLIITAGQQHRRFLAYNPTLSGPLTELVKTTVKSSQEVKQNYDLSIMLQRAINLCQQNPKGPTFLSLPLDIFEEEIESFHDIGIPNIKTQEGIISKDEWNEIAELLKNNQIALIIDQEAQEAFNESINLAENLVADVYNPFFVNKQVFDTSHYLYKGLLPFTSKEQNELFSKYDIIFIIGKQLGYLIYSEENSIPEFCKVIHLNNSEDGINYNFKTDYTLVGNIKESINILNNILKDKIDLKKNKKTLKTKSDEYRKNLEIETKKILAIKENLKGLDPKAIAFHALDSFPDDYSIVLEGCSEWTIVASLAKRSKPNCIFYVPRGAGLGWAMPVAIGVSYAKKEPVICFVGDGGSIYSIQSIWTAFKQKLPVIFICFENRAYHILKELSLLQNPDFDPNKFVGMDFKESKPDLNMIAEGFGAISYIADTYEKLRKYIKISLDSKGPIWITVPTLSEI